MRFYCDGPNIPDLLLKRRDQGRVVFLCGAGVSIGAGMPDFLGLTAEVMDFFDPPTDSGLFKAFQPWRDATDDDTIPKVPLDQIFQQLYRDYPRNEVNTIIAERLCAENIPQSHHHNILKRLSADQNGKPQIVTTNFDRLFELGSYGQLSIYEPPAFPDIHLGIPLAGITYLHGRLQEPNATNHPYILSSADLGRAYLAEGWATRFILSLLKNYTVVMVGYSGDDPTVKYLLQGLNHDEKSDRSKLYAFDKGKPEDIEAKWHERGVTPIAFSDFNELWRSLEAWASRADNRRTWRQQIIALAQKSPSDLSPSQRGQVCHLVSTVSGAKLFSRAQPSPPAEWLCVFDAICRTKVIKSTYEEYEQNKSPYDVYHIGSDTRPSDENDNSAKAINLLRWHPNDSNSVAPDGLVNVATPEHYNISNRLYWLMQWINRVIDSPVVIWWLFRQVRLHPSFLLTLKRTVKHNASLPTEARRAWDFLFHYHSTTPRDGIGRCWYDLIHRVQTEGWSVSVLNDLESVTKPLIKVSSPYGHYTHFPPLSGWNEIRFNNLSSLEVSFGHVSADKFNVPDDNVYQVFRILENNLLRAVDLHNAIDIRYRTTPPLSHLHESSSSHHHSDEKILGLLLTLFKRLIKLNPTYARAHAEIWSFDESHYFYQLKLFALSQPQLFEADQAIQAVLDLPQETFWRWENRLEILYLIRDRWADISSGKQSKIITFLLNDRSDSGYEDQEEKYRYHRPCAYITWLQQNGCSIAPEQAELLNQITQKLDDWNDEWVNALEAKDRSVGWVRKNTNADSISNLSISQISDAATEQTTHNFSSFTDHQPFSGLVQQQPRKALAALSHKARNNEYPKERWSDLIEEWPKDLSTKSPRLYRVFLLRLKKLPAEIIQHLAHTLSSWINENFATAYNFDQTLAWELFSFIADCFQSGDGSKVSDIGMSRHGKPISSKTYFHAINSPMGKMTRGLFQALYSQKLSSGQGLPNSFEIQLTNLLNCRGEGLDHVVCILSYHLTWLYRIDPKWSTAIIVSWLNFEHSHSEAAWNGLVNSHRFHPKLIVLVRAQLIRLLPKLHDWECDQDLQISATKLIMEICYKQHDCFPPLISASETKNILRQVSDENRREAIRWLNIIGQEDPEKWEVICSFIDSTWPRERQFRTASLAGRWVDLLSDTGRHFPDVYQSVQRFLVPTSCHSLYEFSRDDSHEKTLTSLYPEIVLDMLDRMTSNTISELPYQIGEVLPLITEAQPELEGDRRYQRLIRLLDQV